MREYYVDGNKYTVYRDFDSVGPSILEHTVDYLLNLLEEYQKESIEEMED